MKPRKYSGDIKYILLEYMSELTMLSAFAINIKFILRNLDLQNISSADYLSDVCIIPEIVNFVGIGASM